MTAYWIVRVTVTDGEKYAEYVERAGVAVGQFGGSFTRAAGPASQRRAVNAYAM